MVRVDTGQAARADRACIISTASRQRRQGRQGRQRESSGMGRRVSGIWAAAPVSQTGDSGGDGGRARAGAHGQRGCVVGGACHGAFRHHHSHSHSHHAPTLDGPSHGRGREQQISMANCSRDLSEKTESLVSAGWAGWRAAGLALLVAASYAPARQCPAWFAACFLVLGWWCCSVLGAVLGAWCTACFARLRLWSGATTATRMMMMMIPLLGTVIQLSVHTLSAYSAYIIHHSPFTTATPHASHNSSAGHPGDRRIRARPSIAASHLNSLPPASPASPLVPHHSTCLSNPFTSTFPSRAAARPIDQP
jgi:hypothetical protein